MRTAFENDLKGIVYQFFYGRLGVHEDSSTNCLAMAANVTLKSGIQAFKRIPVGLLKLIIRFM